MYMRLWRQDGDMAQRVGDMKFILYDKEYYTLVKGAKKFQYLGRMIEHTYKD